MSCSGDLGIDAPRFDARGQHIPHLKAACMYWFLGRRRIPKRTSAWGRADVGRTAGRAVPSSADFCSMVHAIMSGVMMRSIRAARGGTSGEWVLPLRDHVSILIGNRAPVIGNPGQRHRPRNWCTPFVLLPGLLLALQDSMMPACCSSYQSLVPERDTRP
jgi:hypothetical protein